MTTFFLTFRHEHQSVRDFEDAYWNPKRAGIFLVHPICPLYLAICIDTLDWHFQLILFMNASHWNFVLTLWIGTLRWHFYQNANSVRTFLAHLICALCVALRHFVSTLCIDTLQWHFLMKCKQCWNFSCASDPRTLCVRLFSGSTPLFTLLAESTRLSGN